MRIDFDESVSGPRVFIPDSKLWFGGELPAWPWHAKRPTDSMLVTRAPNFMGCIDNAQDYAERGSSFMSGIPRTSVSSFDSLGELYLLILFGHAGLTVSA